MEKHSLSHSFEWWVCVCVCFYSALCGVIMTKIVVQCCLWVVQAAVLCFLCSCLKTVPPERLIHSAVDETTDPCVLSMRGKCLCESKPHPAAQRYTTIELKALLCVKHSSTSCGLWGCCWSCSEDPVCQIFPTHHTPSRILRVPVCGHCSRCVLWNHLTSTGRLWIQHVCAWLFISY